LVITRSGKALAEPLGEGFKRRDAIIAIRPLRRCIPQLVAGDLNLRNQVIDFVGRRLDPEDKNPAIH
jgi:hypothetical protein